MSVVVVVGAGFFAAPIAGSTFGTNVAGIVGVFFFINNSFKYRTCTLILLNCLLFILKVLFL